MASVGSLVMDMVAGLAVGVVMDTLPSSDGPEHSGRCCRQEGETETKSRMGTRMGVGR